MRIAHLQTCVLEWPPRLHGDPQGSSPLQARHPRVVCHRMPLAQFGVRVDDLRVLHQPVAEVVDDGGDGEDATQTLIKSRFCHDSVLPRATPRPSRGPLRGPNLAESDPATTLRRAASLTSGRPPRASGAVVDLGRSDVPLLPWPSPGCLDLKREAQERADEHDRGQHRHASQTRRRYGQRHRPPAVPGRAGWPASAGGAAWARSSVTRTASPSNSRSDGLGAPAGAGVPAAGPPLSSARDRVGSCGTLAVTTYEHGARAALQAGTPTAEGLELTPGTNQ